MSAEKFFGYDYESSELYRDMVRAWEVEGLDFAVVVGALLEAARGDVGNGLRSLYRNCLLGELAKFERDPKAYRSALNSKLDGLFVVGRGDQ